ncbi:MAG: hypothetical protein FWB96_06255 [Defluviitaleaceae bacterium]|nr:hypothetical protein [Defluviitaleaceae bacterium]MCL2263588.1 hypothetical protein [Defluviitaleaceae bacterium]
MLELVNKRLYEIICLFLDGKMEYADIALLTHDIMSVSNACCLTDELTLEAFMAMWHSNEKYCEMPKEEIIYYKKCFEGNEIFSREKRDVIIEKNKH